MIATLLALTLIRGFDVDIHLDRATKTVHGIQRIDTTAGAPLQLPLKNQVIERISCGEKAATFTTENSMLTVEPCAAGRVTISYTAKEPKGLTFGPSIIFTGFDTCSWMICNDDPSVRAPISLTLHTPGDEWTIAGGALQNVKTGAEGTRTFRWHDALPRPAYLYGFGIGKLRSASTEQGGAVVTVLSAEASHREMEGTLRSSEGMVQFFEKAAGRSLPNQRYAQLVVKGSAAQEKSTFSIIGTDELAALETDPSEDWVIAHEMAHQFWGNSATARSWSEMWLSEGVVTFMTAAWKEHRWGRAAYERELSLAERRVKAAVDAGYDKPLAWPGEYPSLRIRRAIAYSRGALFMDALRKTLGEVLFWQALKTFTIAFEEKSVTSRDFQRSFERASGLDLEPMFRTAVFGSAENRQ
jgi:aminopeptidase N